MRSQSAFVAPIRFDDPAAALAQVRLIYDNSVAHLREALQAFVAGDATGAAPAGPDAQTHVRSREVCSAVRVALSMRPMAFTSLRSAAYCGLASAWVRGKP